ncbi:hypothetical protein Bbelb_157750 [Branchiostoma belcheri]|nr:hypothetical protein Bbelb_157750 [Branchiostoma belcheri]
MALIVRLLQRSSLRKMPLLNSRWTTAHIGSVSISRGQSSATLPLMRSHLVLKNSPQSLQRFSEAKADVYQMDLEDGVPKEEKESALRLYAETLKSGIFHGHSVFVRVSDARDDAQLQKEVQELCHPDLTGFILPKVESSDDIQKTDEILSEVEKTNNLFHGHFKIMPVIESLVGFNQARAIAKASPRISALIGGRGDYAACFKRHPTTLISHSLRLRVVHAAKEAGISAIDNSGYLDNFDSLERDVLLGKNLGFDGIIVLHPRLVPFVNQLYGPTRQEVDWAEKVEAGTRVYQRSPQEHQHFIGPPHLPIASHILLKHNQIKALESSTSKNGGKPVTREAEEVSSTVTPLQLKGGLPSKLKRGELAGGDLSVTLDSSWRTAWSSAFANKRRLNTSDVAAREISLPGIQFPFHLLLMLSPGLTNSKSSAGGRYHLGTYNAVQLKPITDGDTVRAYFSFDTVEEAGSSEKYSIVTSTHHLVNQRDEAVFRLTRKGMFPKFTMEDSHHANLRKDQIPTESKLRDHIIQNASVGGNAETMTNLPLAPNELYVHGVVKAFSPTETRALSNMMRATNVGHIFNIKRFSHDDILVPGPLSVAATVHNAADEFGDILYEEVVEASNLNRVKQDDMIGSLSFIHSVQQLPENNDLEEVTVRTLGIKNLDMEELLDGNFPVRLFSGRDMRSAEYEKICREDFPILYRRIAAQVLWKFLRLRPCKSSDTPTTIQTKFY